MSLVSTRTRYPGHAETARTLGEGCRNGVLATLLSAGQPYTSVIETAPLEDGSLITLLSDLAVHSKNLKQDLRCSLFLQAQGENPLEHPRTSLMGQLTLSQTDYAELYLARHPQAERYLALGDFHFYRFAPDTIYTISGFGHMGWCDAPEYTAAEPDPLAPIAEGATAHMNDDHEHNLIAYAKAFLEFGWAANARMLTLDRYGFDLEARGPDKLQQGRVSFAEPLGDAGDLRTMMVKLAREADERLDGRL